MSTDLLVYLMKVGYRLLQVPIMDVAMRLDNSSLLFGGATCTMCLAVSSYDQVLRLQRCTDIWLFASVYSTEQCQVLHHRSKHRVWTLHVSDSSHASM